MEKSKILLFLFLWLVLSDCSPRRNLVYFSDLGTSEKYDVSVVNSIDPTIQSGDLLRITVSSLNAESNNLFNGRPIGPSNNNTANNNNNNSPDYQSQATDGYLVDKDGMINFPVIGKLKLGGLTISQAREKSTTAIQNYLKDPIVNVKFLNFKVTVVGEVNRPSTLTVTNDRITILEALGQAGDMTPYGKRENVLIIREKDGRRSIVRLNLNDKDVLRSPYFYLQQNDVVYVEPDKAKAAQVSNTNLYLPVIVSVASIVAIILTRKL